VTTTKPKATKAARRSAALVLDLADALDRAEAALLLARAKAVALDKPALAAQVAGLLPRCGRDGRRACRPGGRGPGRAGLLRAGRRRGRRRATAASAVLHVHEGVPYCPDCTAVTLA